MSWISSALSKVFGKNNNLGHLLLELGKKMLIVLVGQVAQDLQSIAIEEVIKAEASGKDGQGKWKQAYEAIRARLKGEVKEHIINLAIETALAAISVK